MGYQKGETYPAAPLTEGEVKKLLRQFNRHTDAGIRDLAITMLMIGGGLRIAESLNVNEDDMRRGEGLLHVPHGKGNKSRWIGLPDGVWNQIGRWQQRRKKLTLPDDAPLFCTIPRNGDPGGRRIHRENYRKEFYVKVKRAGLQGRVHPHALRHTCAFEMAKEGIQPHVIQKQLGHASLDMTKRYIDHLCPTEVRDAARRRNWVYG